MSRLGAVQQKWGSKPRKEFPLLFLLTAVFSLAQRQDQASTLATARTHFTLQHLAPAGHHPGMGDAGGVAGGVCVAPETSLVMSALQTTATTRGSTLPTVMSLAMSFIPLSGITRGFPYRDLTGDVALRNSAIRDSPGPSRFHQDH